MYIEKYFYITVVFKKKKCLLVFVFIYGSCSFKSIMFRLCDIFPQCITVIYEKWMRMTKTLDTFRYNAK